MGRQQTRAIEDTAGAALHQRLLAGDPTATNDLAVAYLDQLGQWLVARNRHVPEDLCWTAAEDAILTLAKQPQTYDPRRLSLAAYLRMSAVGDLKNLLRAEWRHRRRRAELADVELLPQLGKYLQDERDDPAWQVEQQEEEAQVSIPELPGLTAQEREVVALLVAGERKTAAYALVLGLGGLPKAEQETAVNRVKDRLKKRLKRAGGRHE